MLQVPMQMFPQPVDVVYQALKNSLAHSQSFALVAADDIAKTASITSRIDGSAYAVYVIPGPQGGSMVQLAAQNPANANAQMESAVLFGELNRELMMQQMAASAGQNPPATQPVAMQPANAGVQPEANDAESAAKKPAPWVLYVSIGALAVSVIALILLIVLTPKTGAWLVWVLGLVSLAFSGFSLYAALALDKNVVNRILSGIAVGISVLALIFGCVNMPKAPAVASGSKDVASAPASSDANADSGSVNESASPSTDAGNGSSDTSQTQQPTDANTLDGILAAIDEDEASAVETINAKLAEADGKLGSTYESYVANKQALTDWYATLESETAKFYGKLTANTVKYFQLLSQQGEADPDMDWDEATEEFYDSVYDTTLDNFYDDIYDTTLDDVYDKYYDGALDDKPDNVEYTTWSEQRTECYKAWTNERSDFYKAWSNMRSNVYKLWSEVRSTLWKDKYDFTSDIERFQKKCAPYIASE